MPAHLQVGHRHRREGHRQRLPAVAVVERDIDAALGPGKEEPPSVGVLAHGTRHEIAGDPGHDLRPRLPVIGRPEDVRRLVVPLVAREHRVRLGGIVRGHLDDVRHRVADPLGRHVGPGRAPVARELHEAIVGADPDRARVVRRRGDPVNRVVDLAAGPLVGDRPAGESLSLPLVAGEVGADHAPGRAAVRRLEEHVAAVVDHAAVLRARGHGRRPVKTVPELVGGHGEPHLGIWLDRAADHARHVELLDDALIAAAVDAHRVLGIEGRHGTLAAADVEPVALTDPLPVGAAQDADRRIVLLPAIHAIRKLVVGVDAVELRRRLVVERAPRLAVVHRDLATAVIPHDPETRVGGVHPQGVRIAVLRRDNGEGLAAIGALHQRRVEHKDALGVPRVGDQVDVVPGAGAEDAVLVELRPGLAGVVGPVESATVGLDHRPDALRVGRRHRDRDLPHQPGKPLAEARPRFAAVRRLVESRAGSAGAHLPRQALVVPRGEVQHARVGHVHAELAGPRGRIGVEHLPPRRAAVRGLVNAAVGAGPPPRALRGDEHRVLVLRVHDDARNRLRRLESQVRPALAPVGRLVDTVALRAGDAAHRRFAHADIDHAGIRRRHGDRSHGAGLEPAVGEVAPIESGVVGLPDAPAGGAEVVGERLARHARDGGDTTAAIRPDVAPLHPPELRRVEGPGLRRGRYRRSGATAGLGAAGCGMCGRSDRDKERGRDGAAGG